MSIAGLGLAGDVIWVTLLDPRRHRPATTERAARAPAGRSLTARRSGLYARSPGPCLGPARVASGALQIMYAVVKTGGKQYRVTPGAVIKVERLEGEVGATIALDQVLMIGDAWRRRPRVGTPLIDGAKVAAEVLEQAEAPKVIVFKKKRRKNYRRKRGHRQLQTVLRIQDIALA